jgi:hypothetical protein
VIDGSKALRAAIDAVYGRDNPAQRCRSHEVRNVLDHALAQACLPVESPDELLDGPQVGVEQLDGDRGALGERLVVGLDRAPEDAAHPAAADPPSRPCAALCDPPVN